MKLWDKKHVLVISTLVLLSSVASAGLVAGQEQPGEPVNLYGSIEQQDGTPAPEGITLFAIVDGQVEDNITVSPAGEYGGPETFDDALTINTGAGSEVEFRVFSPDGPVASETFDLSNAEPGRQRFNLTFPDGAFNNEASFQTEIVDAPAQVAVGNHITVDYQVENTGNGAGGQTISFAVDGETEDTEVVNLNSGGTFTGTFTYTTTSADVPEVSIEVTSNDDTARDTVVINQSGRTLQSVSLTLASNTIDVGGTTQATVTAEFDDGTTEDVSTQATITSEGSAATVDGTTITGESAGSVVISAEYSENGTTAADTADITIEQSGGGGGGGGGSGGDDDDVGGGSNNDQPQDTPTSSPTPTSTASTTSTPTPTASPTPTPTPTASPSPTESPTPTDTPATTETENSTPGFGTPVALISLTMVIFLAVRRSSN
jgi:Predicted solute binding protein